MICFRPLLGNIASLTALILLLLCLFAGSSRQFLPYAEILKINTSQLDFKDTPDFFNVYLMSYCYGFEKECIVNGDSNAKTVQTIIAGCSDQTPLFSFDAGQAFLEAIGAAGTISDVGWPSYLSDDFTALAPTTQAMSVFFILGTSMVGLSVMLCLTTIRYIWQPRGTMSLTTGLESPPNYPGYADSSLSDTPPSKLKLLISVTSCFFLSAASIIATIVCTQYVALLNRSGSPSISAESNSNFLGMAWAATIIQLIITIDILVAIIRYRARHCRCDWERLPAASDVENKRLFSEVHRSH